MKSALHDLSRESMLSLATAISGGWLLPPFSALGISSYVPYEESRAIAAELERLRSAGFSPIHLAETLLLMGTERQLSQAVEDRLELVWTGPDVPGCIGRDTWVVVRDLFSKARKSLLISTFTIRKGHEVFRPIVDAKLLAADSSIRIFINIARGQNSASSCESIVSLFAQNFWAEHWPWNPRPCVYYDPRGIQPGYGDRANLHAKCIVADDEVAFVSSANFTEWAQVRNIEAGVLVNDSIFAKSVRGQFDSLVAASELLLLPGSGN
jgi:phosphatidylserine/phosphatidylglycerophosphate/cardiolipin synthase-like enzyme